MLGPQWSVQRGINAGVLFWGCGNVGEVAFSKGEWN